VLVHRRQRILLLPNVFTYEKKAWKTLLKIKANFLANMRKEYNIRILQPYDLHKVLDSNFGQKVNIKSQTSPVNHPQFSGSGWSFNNIVDGVFTIENKNGYFIIITLLIAAMLRLKKFLKTRKAKKQKMKLKILS
jgi:hypothetical protein